MTDRQHDRAGRQRDVARLRSDVAEIDPWIEHLSGIAEARIAQWNVAKPQRCESALLSASRERDLGAHRRPVTLERFDRKEDAQRQPTGMEHAREPGVFGAALLTVDLEHGHDASLCRNDNADGMLGSAT